MNRGIILFGAMGVGDTTVGKAVAQALQWPHIDLDEYHWRWDTKIPYTVFRSRQERTDSVLQAVRQTPNFVMSGSMWSIRKAFEPYFALGVFLSAPAEVCARRMQLRSVARWGDRVLPGGDMYESSALYRDYLAWAQTYEQDIRPKLCRLQHEQWAQELPCPVLRLDATVPVAENAARIVACYRSMEKTEQEP